ncbi:MAG TPA: calcium-binding protein [Allosphingosinicella sp.]|nr:calcium-binding protein [Allosphingosinicella sp.]
MVIAVGIAGASPINPYVVDPALPVINWETVSRNAYSNLVHQLALNSLAFAKGNGFTGEQLVNGITHTYVSAEVYFELGSGAAEKFGNLKEMFGDNPRDTWRDHWNNEVGRRMAKWAQDNGYGPEVLDRLMLDAMNDPSNPIITSLDDSRIGLHDFDGDGDIELYVHPEPTWTAPRNWDESPWFAPDDPLRPRDYTGLRDPLGEAGEWFKDRWREFANGMENEMRRARRAIEDLGNWARDLFDFSFGRRDPLVLDLNFDGVLLTSLESSSAHFDFDKDGFAERTGWVTPDDGLLVRDLNGNGLVDNGGELFGNATEDGFAALAAFDVNSDGRISAADPVWTDLRLWTDANQDGITQAGEIVTLASQNVASIELAAVASREIRAGNSILSKGGFTLTNGLPGEAVAVAFMTDQVNTVFQLSEGFEYDPEVFSLPNLRGYGLVPDLWVAMSLDPTLKAMVKDLIADASSFTALQNVVGEYFVMVGGLMGGGSAFYPHSYNMQAFDHMLARWAGVDTGYEERVQAENIAEKFMNQQADHAYGNPFFYEAFEKFSTGVSVRLYAQVAELNEHAVFFQIVDSFRTAVPANGVSFTEAELAAILAPARALFASPPILDPGFQYFALLKFDFATDTIAGDIAAFIDAELQSYDFNPAEPWEGYSEWYHDRKPLLEAIDPEGLVLDERHRAYTRNRDLKILEGPNAVYNEIAGGPGDDSLNGDPAGTLVKIDLIAGGAGNDTLLGGEGDDTYVFSDGFGADIVSDLMGRNEIAFQGSLDSTLARYSFANGNWHDLLIGFTGRSESVTIVGYFSANGAPTLERITFPDGLQASGRPIRDAVFESLATSGNDVITAFPLATTLVGLAGNDTLTGRGEGDVLVGGAGNDLLSGGGGDDTYQFVLGDGHDIVRDYSNGHNGWGGTDTIEFGECIATADVTVTQADFGWDLVLTLRTGETVTLDSSVNSANDRIERVVFADGTVWTHVDLMAKALAGTPGNDHFWGDGSAESLSGGAGDDVIDARAGNDRLIGGTGNDILYGSGGGDTYVFALGDGDDIIREYATGFSGWGGFDTIEFAAGIAPADVIVSQADNGSDLVLTLVGTTDRITVDGGLGGGSNFRVEQVRFTDGTTWAWSELVARSTGGTPDNDTLAGDGNANTISGAAGNDVIEGRYGDDILVGGPGSDVLYGSGGNDAYVFAPGDGADIVRDFSHASNGLGGLDTIELAEGISPGDVVVTQADWGWDLLLTIAARPTASPSTAASTTAVTGSNGSSSPTARSGPTPI